MTSGFAAAAIGEIATADDLLAAGDIGRCELVRGELLMMSPAGFEHGVITQRIAAFLHGYVSGNVSGRRLGVVTAAETGFVLARSPDTVRAPDVAFVAESRLPHGRTVGYFEGAPDLAIEVLSPSDIRDEAARARAIGKISDWLNDLLARKGADILRAKGIVAVLGEQRRLVFQAVHMLLEGDYQGDWKPEEARRSRLVFIGRNLDQSALREGFESCVAGAGLCA